MTHEKPISAICLHYSRASCSVLPRLLYSEKTRMSIVQHQNNYTPPAPTLNNSRDAICHPPLCSSDITESFFPGPVARCQALAAATNACLGLDRILASIDGLAETQQAFGAHRPSVVSTSVARRAHHSDGLADAYEPKPQWHCSVSVVTRASDGTRHAASTHACLFFARIYANGAYRDLRPPLQACPSPCPSLSAPHPQPGP